MLGKRKHSLINDSLEHELLRQVVTEQIDLEIALKKRLLAAAEARVQWAKILRDLLLEERTASDVYRQASFHDAAERVYEDIEDSCHIISSHKSRLLRPITSGKPPVPEATPLIEPPRTRKRITLSLANTPVHNGPILYQDRSTGATVKLTCVDCGRSDFPTIQGFLNHCRLAHSRIFNTHDECIQTSGVPIDSDEKEAFRLAGVEIHISNSTSIRGMFERAVGLESKSIESDANGDAESISTHLSRTLGVHALTPTLAPFLGKAVRKKQIHVFEEPGFIDIMSADEEESRKNNLRRQRVDQQKEDKVSPFADVLSMMQQDGSPEIFRTSEESFDSERSRFRVKRRIIIADRSLYLPEGRRSSAFPSHTHRWQLSVYTPSYGHNITTFLDRFTVTCLTQPPVFSQPITVCGPPFVTCSTTDKPFLARLKLCWVGQQNHALEVDHWVELDPSRASRPSPSLGEQQMFDVELDRDTPFRQAQDTTTTVPWTGEGDYKEVPSKLVNDIPGPSSVEANHDLIEHSADYQYMLRGLAVRFPMVSSDAAFSLTPLPYTPARSLTRLFDLPMGTRKALELSRARAIRQEFESMQKNLPETSRSNAKLGTADVFRWLHSNGLYPIPPYSVQTPISAEEPAQPEAKPPEAPRFCSVCGVPLSCHSAMTASHYRNTNGQCSAEQERHRAPVIHVYTLLAPSTAPAVVWNSSQNKLAHKPRDILSIAHPRLLLFARRQAELLSLTCFPRFPLNSSPLELGDTPDEVAATLLPHGILAVVTKFVVRDLVNGAVQVARDMQTRTKIAGTDSISDQHTSTLLTPTHVLESLVIKDDNQTGRKGVFSKCFSRLGTLLQVDTTLSPDKNTNVTS